MEVFARKFEGKKVFHNRSEQKKEVKEAYSKSFPFASE
jgi:hypothetical protein